MQTGCAIAGADVVVWMMKLSSRPPRPTYISDAHWLMLCPSFLTNTTPSHHIDQCIYVSRIDITMRTSRWLFTILSFPSRRPAIWIRDGLLMDHVKAIGRLAH